MMLSHLRTVKILALVLFAVLTAAAQTGPAVLKSPNGALDISIATVRGQAVQADGGQLAYRVTFRGQPVLEWSNLGLLLEGSPALGLAVRIESSQASSQDETWKSVQGKANPIRNQYSAVTVRTVEMAMVTGTRAHATGLFVVFESELQMVSDSPDAYDGQKEIEFLKAVPATWDETRELDVPLSFLGSGTHDAEIYSDGPKAATEPKDSVVAKQRVNAQTVLKSKLAPGGGSAIRLVPVR